MIVYVKKDNDIMQLHDIDYISIDSNKPIGYFDYLEMNEVAESYVAWTIEFKNKRHAIECFKRLRSDLNHNDTYTMIYINEGDVLS